MSTENVNIIGNVIVKTESEWESDLTIYKDTKLLFSSDVFYDGTTFPKFKKGNDVNTWDDLDYLEIPSEAITFYSHDSSFSADRTATMNAFFVKLLGDNGEVIFNDGQSMMTINSEKGVLLPRLDTTEMGSLSLLIGTSETGMIVFNSDNERFMFWDGAAWNQIGTEADSNEYTDTQIYNALFEDKFTSIPSRIEVPSGFDHTLGPFEIVRPVNGTAELLNITSDTFRKKLNSPVIKYVDQINGLDTNTGDSWAQAYKSFNQLRLVSFDRAFVAKGNYACLTNPMFTTENEIISVGGNSTFCFGVIGTERTWTSVGSGTFSNSLTAAITVVLDTTKFDSNGDYFRLTPLTSLAAVQATPDSFWKDAGTNTLYVHYADGLTPSRPSAVMSISAVSFTSNQNQYREGIDFINGVTINNTTANVAVWSHKRCSYLFNTTTNGVTIRGNVRSYFENCKAAKNFLDGFNYHESSGQVPVPIEVYCYAYKNGENNTTSINNGSTVHETVRILRVGGVYFYNEGPNIHDVNSSKSLNIDCVAYDSLAVNSANKSNYALGAAASESAIMWLDGCTTHGESTTFGAEDRSGLDNIMIRNSYISNIEPGTSLTPY